jgi:hypothetical protein
MRSSVADGDLASVIDAAVAEKLERLERRRSRCVFVDAPGRRCTARTRLEFHHRHTFALGGEHSSTNVALLCRMHNRYSMAEIDYGAEALSRFARRGPRSDRSSS